MNYIDILGEKFPNVQAECHGDPTVFEDIVWIAGDPMPTAEQFAAADIEFRQRAKWKEISTERDRRYYQGVYLQHPDGNSYWFWTDAPSRDQYTLYDVMVRMLNLPQSHVLDNWKTMEHAWVPFTVAMMYQVVLAGVQSEQLIFNTAESKKQEMLLLANPDEYDAKTGWPICFSDIYPNGAPDSYPPQP